MKFNYHYNEAFAAEKVLKSRLTERRRSSLIRLQGRIREKQQNKKGTDAGIEKIGNQALQQQLAGLLEGYKKNDSNNKPSLH